MFRGGPPPATVAQRCRTGQSAPELQGISQCRAAVALAGKSVVPVVRVLMLIPTHDGQATLATFTQSSVRSSMMPVYVAMSAPMQYTRTVPDVAPSPTPVPPIECEQK